QGWGQGDFRLLAQRLAYVLGHRYEAVALAVRQVDRLVLNLALMKGVDARGYAAHAVVHVGEVEHLLLAVDGDRLLAGDAPDEQGYDPLHALEVVVVAPVDVGEAK